MKFSVLELARLGNPLTQPARDANNSDSVPQTRWLIARLASRGNAGAPK